MAEQIVWKVKFKNGETCHFGNYAAALAYARENGTVEEVLIKQADLAVVESGFTPNSKLPPIGGNQRMKILIEIEVPTDWERRLDMQWVVEREIAADRWSWRKWCA